jgi:hypothetical protein
MKNVIQRQDPGQGTIGVSDRQAANAMFRRFSAPCWERGIVVA